MRRSPLVLALLLSARALSVDFGVPLHPLDVVLGRPTDHSVTVSVVAYQEGDGYVEFGPASGGTPVTTATRLFAAETGVEFVLDDLLPNVPYTYRVFWRSGTDGTYTPTAARTFRTARPAGQDFTFTIQADAHLDSNTSMPLYARTLANALADAPDFHVDLGDTFMTGKHESRETALLQYAAQRYYLGLIGHAAPVFLVLGNHDGEETKNSDATRADGLAVWSCTQRKRLFPNPVPDAFYTGNTAEHPYAGLLQDYYAWTWGDALFVVLDPYWTSRSTRGGREPWNMTLGKDQYDWLARTLRQSRAKFKFIFIHQLVGGLDQGGRGGAEAAGLFEWGGQELDGRRTFAVRRPGWERPIREMLVETGVNIVFHGHDHFFAHQERDGVVYQLVPQPAHWSSQKHSVAEYGYKTGDFLPSSGHLRVHVDPDGVTVAYVRAATPDMARHGIRNGETAFEYTLGR